MDVTKANAIAPVSIPKTETTPGATVPVQTQTPSGRTAGTPSTTSAAIARQAAVEQTAAEQTAKASFRAELQNEDTRLQLDIDRSTGRQIVIARIVNAQTGKLVEQIPSEETIHYLARTREILGTILDKKA